MVGANTVRQDNPQLTVRHGFANDAVQLRPIVITLSDDIPHDSHVFAFDRNTIVITSNQISKTFLTMLDTRHIEHYEFPLIKDNLVTNNGRLDLRTILDKLGELHISSLLVEGGAQLLTSFFSSDLVNQVYVYIAPKIIGGNGSLSPIMGDGLVKLQSSAQFHSEQNINLSPDLCFIAETLKTPKTYEDFVEFKGDARV